MTPDVPDHRPSPAPAPVAPRGDGGGPPRFALRVGRYAGVPIYLHASYLLLAGLVLVGYGPLAGRSVPGIGRAGGYALAGGFVLVLLVSVLLHELGHAVVARRHGIGVRAITLELLGGYTEMTGDSPTPRADALVSLVGPAISAGLGGLGLALQSLMPPHTIAEQLAFQLAWSNLIVAVFNALPGLPLDGGRALRALVWALTGNRHTGTRVAAWVGRVIALATLAVAVTAWSAQRISYLGVGLALAVAMVVWQGAGASIRAARVAANTPGLDLRRLARPIVAVASGTPLAEALRRAATEGFPGAVVVVADSAGRIIAIVSEREVARVAPERRPWVPVDSAARTLDCDRTLPADLTGEDVVAAVQAHPAPSYLVVAGDQVLGVLRTADLVRRLNS
jgi:Zn-dependent protease